MKSRWIHLFSSFSLVFAGISAVSADDASTAKALKFRPIQADVEYDIPTEADIAKCSMQPVSAKGEAGWYVVDGAGKTLRKFVDTNRDNNLDVWSYYRDGIEVYRDIDADFDGRADQYRWMGMAGTRWGIDSNEDKQIDSWKMISAEELSAEIVTAIKTKDVKRFRLALLTPEEVKALGLGKEKETELLERVEGAAKGFEKFIAEQKEIGATAQWSSFGGTRPGTIPAGTNGSTKDLIVYENTTALVEAGANFRQLILGLMVRVDDGWRVTDLPEFLVSGKVAGNGGTFFQASLSRTLDNPMGGGTEPVADADQKLLLKLGELETKINAGNLAPAQINALYVEYADTLVELAVGAAKEEEKFNWIRQAADTLKATAQEGKIAPVQEKLQGLEEAIKGKLPENCVAYVRMQNLEVDYYFGESGTTDADHARHMEKWTEGLKKLVADFPKTDVAANALRELGVQSENSNDSAGAIKHYQMLVDSFPSSPQASFARGAIWRLSSAGKDMALQGANAAGQPVNITNFKGKTVIVAMFASYGGDANKPEIDAIKDVQAKYPSKGIEVLLVNFDGSATECNDFIKKHKLSWPHIYATGGVDGAIANQFGVQAFPVLFLVNKDGKVVRQGNSMAELQTDLISILK